MNSIILQDDTPMKRCTLCENEFPATTVFFYANGNSQYGVLSQCKDCIQKRRRKKPKIHVPEGFKRCNQCTHILPANLENFACEPRNKSDGLAGMCRACKNDKNRKYDRTERGRANSKKHRQTYKDYFQTCCRNRRARLKNVPGHHTTEDVKQQYKRQKGKCYWCGDKLDTGKRAWHVDHIVPVTRGGTNWPDNLVIACHTCNESKGNRLPHEWARGGRLL